jgi:DNA-binding NarL/FixJ family response regulator
MRSTASMRCYHTLVVHPSEKSRQSQVLMDDATGSWSRGASTQRSGMLHHGLAAFLEWRAEGGLLAARPAAPTPSRNGRCEGRDPRFAIGSSQRNRCEGAFVLWGEILEHGLSSTEQRPRVLLADDHPLLLEGLRKLLEPALEVAGVAMDGRELLRSAEALAPDLVITDISMPGIDGIEVTRRLQALCPGVRVVILSVHAGTSWVRAALQAGARGYLTKTSAPDEIELAVREVLDDRLYVSPAVAQALVAAMADGGAERPGMPPLPAGEPLTPREADVVRLVGLGLGNRDIAERLGLSVTTVRTHLNRVYDKLKLASRVELALLAVQNPGAPV